MGYRIDYSNGSRKAFRTSMVPKRLWVMALACFLLFLVLTNHFWPQRANNLRHLLIPGDPEVTTQAFETMIHSLCAGEEISEAVTAFCREILEHAQLPD